MPMLSGILQTAPLSAVTSYELITIPMFLLMAEFVLVSGIADDLFKATAAWVGRIPGGLGMATALAGAGFGAICGTSTASAATLSATSLPAMLKQGYEPKMAAGVVAISGTLAMLIPPSVALVIYGLLAEVNIGALLIGGVIPGILVTITIMATVWFLAWQDPSRAPSAPAVSLIEKFQMLRVVGPMLLLFGMVTGVIYTGVATPTEASALGAFGSFSLAGWKGKINWQSLRSALLRSAHGTCMIAMILFGASIFGYFFTLTQVGDPDDHPVRLHRARLVHGPDRHPGTHGSDRAAVDQISRLRSVMVRCHQDRHSRGRHDHAARRIELLCSGALFRTTGG
jgi:tripartite ATP-independent transporter DctM subunit